jgi:probable HAF family extracellular repeat protein
MKSIRSTKETNPIWAGAIAILLLMASLPRPAAAQAGTFSATGNASNARTVHTATLLPNGKVLVAGGFSPPSPTYASAEVYDPNTGLFTATGSLIAARRAHTATLLPDGRVLVAGGRLPPAYFASAELYDPGTGLFSSTGSMATPRAFYTATLLASGKVLVAGGLNAGVYLASAELYDPNTGLFSPTGSMNIAREAHTATLLPDGRVLIAGGDVGAAAFASAELYDPDTGKFTATGSMGAARTYHTATLLPPSTLRPHGKVLIAGGDGTSRGGPSTALASAELYDPDTGTFSATGSMSNGRWNHTATLLPAYELRPHGKVLVAGGDSGAFSSGILASAELYDPDTGKFTTTGSLNSARHQQTATLLPNGAVLVAEGDNAVHAMASAEIYALPPTYTITDLGELPGGTYSEADSVRSDGLLGGIASPADGTQHAVLWYNGQMADISLPGLGGKNSGVFGINQKGQVLIAAETATPDPNNENFCAYGTGLTCLGAVWQNGVTTLLPTLGGPNATVGGINNRGEIAGLAENSTKDKNCALEMPISATGPQLLDFEAVIWGPNPGQIRQLNPLPGDTVGEALAINDNGQAVGASGTCANTVPPPIAFGAHAVLWDTDGSVTDLGNLGAEVSNIGLSINNQGQVVGVSSATDQSPPHAFLWTKATGMQDLGTLPGDILSVANSINDRGEVVGESDDPNGNARAYLRQNGVMMDLNALIPAGSPLFLLCGLSINSSGQIAGFGMTSAGDVHAYLATPTSGVDTGENLSSVARGMTRPPVLRDDARKLFQRRMRFGAQFLTPR